MQGEQCENIVVLWKVVLQKRVSVRDNVERYCGWCWLTAAWSKRKGFRRDRRKQHKRHTYSCFPFGHSQSADSIFWELFFTITVLSTIQVLFFVAKIIAQSKARQRESCRICHTPSRAKNVTTSREGRVCTQTSVLTDSALLDCAQLAILTMASKSNLSAVLRKVDDLRLVGILYGICCI